MRLCTLGSILCMCHIVAVSLFSTTIAWVLWQRASSELLTLLNAELNAHPMSRCMWRTYYKSFTINTYDFRSMESKFRAWPTTAAKKNQHYAVFISVLKQNIALAVNSHSSCTHFILACSIVYFVCVIVGYCQHIFSACVCVCGCTRHYYKVFSIVFIETNCYHLFGHRKWHIFGVFHSLKCKIYWRC